MDGTPDEFTPAVAFSSWPGLVLIDGARFPQPKSPKHMLKTGLRQATELNLFTKPSSAHTDLLCDPGLSFTYDVALCDETFDPSLSEPAVVLGVGP
jgi:hypothetical protein